LYLSISYADLPSAIDRMKCDKGNTDIFVKISSSKRIPEAARDFSFAADAPNILKGDLVYEIGAGCDWRLREAYILKAQVAYWKPGSRFKFACVDRTRPTWDIPKADNMWGTNPNREIDPILPSSFSEIQHFSLKYSGTA
jgi:hypothetical protein